MCGLSAILGPGANKNKIIKMNKTLSHRGPDNSDIFLEKNIALGHTRLSIIDLDYSANQPMTSKDGRYIIIFNGEIYNYLELKKQIHNYQFITKSDTEVLLASYIKWGEACVKKFIGMFAFAIWDRKLKQLFCARDHIGIKPLFFCKIKNDIFISSEIKGILSAGVRAEPNKKMWAQYLLYGQSDHTEMTFFQNINQLPAGSILKIKNNKYLIKPYWQLENISNKVNIKSNESELIEEFRFLINDSIKLQLRSDVPVGLSLSGGLDSTSLMYFIDNQLMGNEDIYSLTGLFKEKNYNENIYTKQIKTKNNWKNINKYLTSDNAWSNFEELTFFQEAPFGGLASTLLYLLSKKAKESGIKVMLQAEGVDELFAGHQYYHYFNYMDIIEKKRNRLFRK